MNKFAQTTATQSVIVTLLSGVLIGSYTATQVANNYASAIGLVFAFVGGMIIGRIGSKKGTVWFSWVAISFVGYANSVPQMGDEATYPVFYLALFLSFVLPILGFVCNLLAMKNYTLDPKTLAEVQARNQARRQENQKAAEKEA